MKKNLIYISAIIVLAVIVFFVVRYFVTKDPLDVDVSDIDITVKTERFDIELQQVNQGDPYQNITELEKKYTEFFEIYNYEIIGIGGTDNSSYLVYLQTFLNDYSVSQATKMVSEQYKDMSKIDAELTDGFKHLKYYFPDAKIPRIVTFVAGFNHSVVYTGNFIGIGLDKYLGSECELYTMLDIPDYSRLEMTPEQISIDVMTAYAESEYPFQPDTETLLEFMIYNGRKLYFLDAMFPEFSEARKNKYTEDQLRFCIQFERDMWTSLIENKLLFVTEYLTVRKFIESAPFTSQFGPDSPPRTANWLGLQIVRSYMENNKVSLEELMKETDYQKILNLSEYDPKYN